MPVAAVTDDAALASVQGVLDILSAASRLLSGADDFEATIPVLARLLVPQWVDSCTIGLNDDAGEVRIVASLGDEPPEATLARRRPHAPIVNAGDGRWSLELAITARGQGFGFLWLRGSGDGPSPIVSGLADELVVRIAVALDAARAIAREQHIAETLQRALLPDQLPRCPAVTLDAAYRPAAGESIVGGDWYDAFELPDGRIGVSIGDVAGHGLSAAVVMSEARQAVRASAFDARDPAEVLSRANQMLRTMPMMVTALVGVYDPRTSVFTYASAGHPPPVVVIPGGHAFVLPCGDFPLGVAEDLAPAAWTFTLQPGALLVLYTDGMVEYARDLLSGEHALLRAVLDEASDPSATPAKSIQERIFGSAENSDDVATLTLAVAPSPQDSLEFVFSAVPFSAPFVRRTLERYLAQNGVDDDRRFSVISAVGEAVANAVEHAYMNEPGIVRLSVQIEGSLIRIHIEDSGRWRPARKEDERGRGIPLMRALMDRVEIRTERTSTQVRMQLQMA